MIWLIYILNDDHSEFGEHLSSHIDTKERKKKKKNPSWWELLGFTPLTFIYNLQHICNIWKLLNGHEFEQIPGDSEG